MADRDRHIDIMKFDYLVDRHAGLDGKEVLTKRPRVEAILRKNPKNAGGRISPELAVRGLVDSGADSCFIPRSMAKWLKIDLDMAEKSNSIGAGGRFTTYKTRMHLEIIYRGTPVTIGMVDVIVPERDPEGVGLESVLLGRSQLFRMYEITFNSIDATILFRRIDPDARSDQRYNNPGSENHS